MQKSKKHILKYIAIMSFVFVLMIGFQNCQDQKHIINIASRRPQPATNTLKFLFLPETGSNTVRVLSDSFAVNTSLTFSISAFSGQETELEKYTSFEWSIVLHEDLGNSEATVLNQQTTTQPSHQWSFNRSGVYDISAILTSEEGLSANVSRVIVIGQCASSPELCSQK